MYHNFMEKWCTKSETEKNQIFKLWDFQYGEWHVTFSLPDFQNVNYYYLHNLVLHVSVTKPLFEMRHGTVVVCRSFFQSLEVGL